MTQSKYDSYESAGSSNAYDNIELRFTPYTTVRGVVDRVFGSSSEFGQSLGVNMRNVEIVDGALYVDPEKDTYKIFSWKNIAGLSISESLERGNEPSVDDAPEVETKNYAGNDKTYELVAARVPEVTGPDGDTVLEATSKIRDVTVYDDGSIDFGDWEDLDGEPVELDEQTITWYNGSDEYGPSAAAKGVLETFSEFGSNAVVDENDLYNWLPDTSGDNIMRSDLEDREVEFFTVTQESSNGYTYHKPILEDVSTGEQIRPNNAGEGGSGNESESEAVADARAADSDDDYPEPIADFIQSGSNLNMNRERAENLLDELVGSADNALTEDMVEDYGREHIIQQVL
jgi:hypothetical protein